MEGKNAEAWGFELWCLPHPCHSFSSSCQAEMEVDDVLCHSATEKKVHAHFLIKFLKSTFERSG